MEDQSFVLLFALPPARRHLHHHPRDSLPAALARLRPGIRSCCEVVYTKRWTMRGLLPPPVGQPSHAPRSPPRQGNRHAQAGGSVAAAWQGRRRSYQYLSFDWLQVDATGEATVCHGVALPNISAFGLQAVPGACLASGGQLWRRLNTAIHQRRHQPVELMDSYLSGDARIVGRHLREWRLRQLSPASRLRDGTQIRTIRSYNLGDGGVVMGSGSDILSRATRCA